MRCFDAVHDDDAVVTVVMVLLMTMATKMIDSSAPIEL
jgi:hypothetical protein